MVPVAPAGGGTTLGEAERGWLLDLARQTVAWWVTERKTPQLPAARVRGAAAEALGIDDELTRAVASARERAEARQHGALTPLHLLAAMAQQRDGGIVQPLLEKVGVAEELTGKKRNRVFGYSQYLAILAEGTETS